MSPLGFCIVLYLACLPLANLSVTGNTSDTMKNSTEVKNLTTEEHTVTVLNNGTLTVMSSCHCYCPDRKPEAEDTRGIHIPSVLLGGLVVAAIGLFGTIGSCLLQYFQLWKKGE